jgi:hypothetical protein
MRSSRRKSVAEGRRLLSCILRLSGPAFALPRSARTASLALALRSDAAGAMMLRIVRPLTLNAPAVGALGAYKTEAEVP